MLTGNCSQTLERMNSLYQKIRESGKDIYSVNYSPSAWEDHEDIWADDTYIFLLPDRQQEKTNEKIILSDKDFSLLKDYNKQLIRTRIPIDKILSEELNVKRVKEVDLETLETLAKEGIDFLRK